jgi:hypothetical protein
VSGIQANIRFQNEQRVLRYKKKLA